MKKNKTNKLKTIDIHAQSWWDDKNGNSHYSVQITINYGYDDSYTLYIPFKYGYRTSYLRSSVNLLTEKNIISLDKSEGIWTYCDRKDIILRERIKENCLKRDVIAFGIE